MAELIATERTADRLLMLLKTRGAQTTRALAAALGISVPGVQQHLSRLEADGLIRSSQSAGAVGRPALVWSLTERAAKRFPDTHAELTVTLIESIRRSLGDGALESVIAEREASARERYRTHIGDAKTLKTRLARLAELRNAEGYMAEIEKLPRGAWLFSENHCPICAAAQSCQGFCRHELDLFREVLGPDVGV
ncbi:MAG TPA: metalloregulator ArsR/SmtB family transcription factor, partial [Pseudomonadales bacterium]|nr:metalloregulator ArsR/SmtB family transcription factor [Pseudomonadales bacterium]